MKMHEENYKGSVISIHVDEYGQDPREWDNVTKMIFLHKKYKIGDNHKFYAENYNNWEEMEADIIETENVHTIYPVYMYEHSGISLSISPFNCMFDSGQIGFIYITKETCKKEGIEDPQKLLKAKLDLYSKYLNGECYFYQITSNDEEIETIGGYYDISEALDEARATVDFINYKIAQ